MYLPFFLSPHTIDNIFFPHAAKVLLSGTSTSCGPKNMPSTTLHHSRGKVFLLLYLLLSASHLSVAQRTPVTLEDGPHTGIVTQEIPNLLLTDHRTISQLVYLDLDIESALQNRVSLRDVHDPEVLLWYARHLERTKDSIKEILSQAEKTLIVQTPQNPRPRRAIGAVIMGIVALLTVVGAVVGSTMCAVNRVSVKEVQLKNEVLQAAIVDIQKSLETQHKTNEHFVKIVQDTIVVASLQNDRMDHSTKLHEQLTLSKNLFYSFVEPILYFTNNYLRQVEIDMNNLLRAHIPLYFVDVHLVRTALSTLHGPDLDPTQIRIAFETGSAIPMYIDTERLHVSFLLNIPLVKLEKIYQLKKVINVGTWKGETKLKINSPEFVAYQNTSNMYLIPQLQTCQVFKDLNYLCPGNPFTPVTGGLLCGLEVSNSDSTLCDVTVTRTSDIVTEAVLINNKWLVSTNARNMTVTYTKHGTFAIKPITHSTFTIIVPKDVIIGIGAEILFHVSTEELEGGMVLVNTFKPFSIPHNPDLEFLLDKKHTHSIQLLLSRDNVSISNLKMSIDDSAFFTPLVSATNKPFVLWCCLISPWILILTILVIIQDRYLRKLKKEGNQQQTEIAIT